MVRATAARSAEGGRTRLSIGEEGALLLYVSVMPSNVPSRDRRVYMVGAGASSAFRLPNTPSLLNEVIRFSRTGAGRWLEEEDLESRLRHSYRFFYPDARNEGFQPDVVDFFSALRTFVDIGSGLAGTGFEDARDLYRLLKRGIAHILIHYSKQIDEERFRASVFLREMVQPGHIIITSNWDTLVERYAAMHSIPLRLTSRTRHFSKTEVTLLKLHGSLDWCQVQSRVASYPDADFAHLSELQNPARPWTMRVPEEAADLVRVRSDLGDAWQRIKARSREPWMVTMVTGKQDDLGPLQDIWRDAYRALSRADRLEIVGYSMPPDDVEIRTILRAGVQRGGRPPAILVRNPAPDVHYRVRAFLDRHAESDYMPVAL